MSQPGCVNPYLDVQAANPRPHDNSLTTS
jgi:hypothetical protein